MLRGKGLSIELLHIGRPRLCAFRNKPATLCTPSPRKVFRPSISLLCSDARTPASSFEECQELLSSGDTGRLKEKFLLKMLEMKGSTSKLEGWMLRLRRLEEMGLKWYEIGEGPSLMETEEYIIQTKLAYLEAAGHDRVSIRMLHLLDSRRWERSLRALKKWMNEVNPSISITEDIMRRLECSENDIICLYFTQIGMNLRSKSLIDKFILLKNAGFSLRDICTHAHLLQYATHKSLKQRLKSKPKCFTEIMGVQPMIELSQLLGVSEESLQNSELITTHGASYQRLRKLLQRIKVLLEAGYDPIEVRCYLETCSSRTLLRESSAKYVESLAQLKAEGLTVSSGLELRALGIHSRRKQLLQDFRALRPNRYDIAKSLNCHLSEIQLKLPREKLFSHGFTRSHISKNLHFLLECGIDDDVIKRLPSVLCVNPRVLSQAWDYVIAQPRFSDWKTNNWKLLNVLLYFAEKWETHVHEY